MIVRLSVEGCPQSRRAKRSVPSEAERTWWTAQRTAGVLDTGHVRGFPLGRPDPGGGGRPSAISHQRGDSLGESTKHAAGGGQSQSMPRGWGLAGESPPVNNGAMGGAVHNHAFGHPVSNIPLRHAVNLHTKPSVFPGCGFCSPGSGRPRRPSRPRKGPGCLVPSRVAQRWDPGRPGVSLLWVGPTTKLSVLHYGGTYDQRRAQAWTASG